MQRSHKASTVRAAEKQYDKTKVVKCALSFILFTFTNIELYFPTETRELFLMSRF